MAPSRRVARSAAMDRERAQVQIVRAAVVHGAGHPGDQHCEIRVVSPGRNGIEDIFCQDSLLGHALDVDDRRLRPESLFKPELIGRVDPAGGRGDDQLPGYGRRDNAAGAKSPHGHERDGHEGRA